MKPGAARRRTHLISIALFAALLLLGHWQLGRRSERRWLEYRAGFSVRGIVELSEQLQSDRVADGENFARAPFVARGFQTEAGQRLQLPPGKIAPHLADFTNWKPTDWDKIRDEFAAAGWLKNQPAAATPASQVLDALQHLAPAERAWREAAERRKCQFALNWETGAFDLTHHAALADAVDFFLLRARAKLETGAAGEAAGDVVAAIVAAGRLGEEPLFVSLFHRQEMFSKIIGVLGEGLYEHRWAEPQLAEIGTALHASGRVLPRLSRVLECERWLQNRRVTSAATEQPARARLLAELADRTEGPADRLRSMLMPRRQIYDNLLWTNYAFDWWREEFQRTAFTLPQLHDNPASAHHLDQAADRWWLFYACRALPGIEHGMEEMALSEAMLALAVAACAIELHRLHHRHFPAQLDQLAPEWQRRLFPDPLTGQPLHYTLRDDGVFLLYSAGLDRAEHGGACDRHLPLREQTDVLWLYSPGLR